MKKFYVCDTNIPKSGFLTNRLQILTFLIKNKNPKTNKKLLRTQKVNIRHTWYMNKNSISLKNHFPVLVAYHESSSHGYSSFFAISQVIKISKGGGKQEREFQPTPSLMRLQFY